MFKDIFGLELATARFEGVLYYFERLIKPFWNVPFLNYEYFAFKRIKLYTNEKLEILSPLEWQFIYNKIKDLQFFV